MSSEPITNLPFLYKNGMTPTWLSNTTLSVSSGQCRDSTNSFDLVSNAPIAVNTAAAGANGLDKGTIAASTWYSIWIIADTIGSNTTRAILSTSSTSPTLPYGYSAYRRIGWMLTNSSSQLIKVYFMGNASVNTVFYDSIVNVLGGTGSTSYMPTPLTTALPPTVTLCNISWTMVPNAAGDIGQIRPTGSTATGANVIRLFGSVAAVGNSGAASIITNASQSIDYLTTSALDGLSVYVTSYVDYL